MPEQQYYMVVDEQTVGPFTLEEIKSHPRLTPETLVWKPGIENWIAAREMVELQTPPVNPGIPNDNFPPRNPESMQNNNPFANNPQYRRDHTYTNNQNGYNQEPRNDYNNQNGYRQNDYNQGGYHQYQNRPRRDYQPANRTNWLPWAIVATVVGFLTSCIGAIFGIIGIVQANKANTFFAQGMEAEGRSANSNAKTMTIIGLVFAGLGLIISIIYFGTLASALTYLY